MADDERPETAGFPLGESSIKPEWTAEGSVLVYIGDALTEALDNIRQERDEALATLAAARAAMVGVLEGCWDQVDGMVIEDPEAQTARARVMRALTEGINVLAGAGEADGG